MRELRKNRDIVAVIIMTKKVCLSGYVNYLYLAYVLTWPVLNKTILPFDGAGRIGLLLLSVSLFFNLLSKGFADEVRKPPVSIWLVWVVYVSVSWYIQGYNVTECGDAKPVPDLLFVITRFFTPFYAMLIVVYEMQRDEFSLLKWVLGCYVIFVLVGTIVGDKTITEDGRIISVLGNELPLGAMAMSFVVACLSIQHKLSTKLVLIFLTAAFVCVLSAATRKAFIGLSIITFFLIVAKFEMYKPQKLFMLLCICLICYLSLQYVLDNTTLGERFAATEDDAELYNTSGIYFLNFLGDRAIFYIMGWKVFLEHPLLGIGVSNFQVITGYPLPIHSEYIVQLCEGGIIGVVLFISFYNGIFKCIKGIKRISASYRGLYLVFLSLFLSILFINFTAWTYQFPHYFICFGIIIGKSRHVSRHCEYRRRSYASN